MSSKNFKTIGLRRDQSLSDVENRSQALSNILNDFVSSDPSSTYDAEDLLTVIENLHTQSLPKEELLKTTGLTVLNTVVLDGGIIATEPARPLITLKNQHDRIVFDTKLPPYFRGGDGLVAKFWDASDIVEYNYSANNSNAPATGLDVITDLNNFQVEKFFWSSGVFSFSNKLDNTLAGANGLIQWDGFFMPPFTRDYRFLIETTGFFIFEIEDQLGNLTVLKNIYTTRRSFGVAEDVVNSSTIPIQQGDSVFIVVNDELTGTTNPSTGLPYRVIAVSEEEIRLDGTINATSGSRIDIDLSSTIGVEEWFSYVTAISFEEYVPRRIRLTYWYPDSEDNYETKDLRVGVDFSSTFFPYQYLYSVLPDYTNPANFSTFKKFSEDRLLSGGGQIGTINNTKEVISTNSLIIDYDPPTALQFYDRSSDTTLGSNIIRITDTSNIELGNYIVSSAIPKYTQVRTISTNRLIVMTDFATNTGEFSLRFLTHKGFVDYFLASSSGTTVTIEDGTTTFLRTGMVVLTESSTGPSYSRITSINHSANTFITSNSINVTSKFVYVYYDAGLVNNLTYQLIDISVTGSSTLLLNDTTGIEPGYIIESVGNNSIVEGTVVVSVASRQVTLDTPLAQTLNTGDLVYAIRANVNTAPPFRATDTGLSTNLLSEGTRGLLINNGKLTVNDLVVVSSNAITTTSSSYNKTVPIELNNGNYKILGSDT